jgi:hypothetical protein
MREVGGSIPSSPTEMNTGPAVAAGLFSCPQERGFGRLGGRADRRDQRGDALHELCGCERLGQGRDVRREPIVAMGVDVQNWDVRVSIPHSLDEREAVEAVHMCVQDQKPDVGQLKTELDGRLTIIRLEYRVTCHPEHAGYRDEDGV